MTAIFFKALYLASSVGLSVPKNYCVQQELNAHSSLLLQKSNIGVEIRFLAIKSAWKETTTYWSSNNHINDRKWSNTTQVRLVDRKMGRHNKTTIVSRGMEFHQRRLFVSWLIFTAGFGLGFDLIVIRHGQ